MLKKIFICLVFVLWASCALAATWYVAPSTETTTGAGTRDQPFKCNSINWTSIAAGDTIYLRTALGNYNEMLTIGKSGTTGNYITIDSDPADGGKAVFDGQNIRTRCIDGNAKTYIILKNIIGNNTANSGANNTCIGFFSNWKIYNCDATNGYYGFSGGSGVTSPYIDSCTISECDYSISLYNAASGSILKNITATATTKSNVLYIAGGHPGVLSIDGLYITGGTSATYANIDIRNCSFGVGSEIKNSIIKNGKGGIYTTTTANLIINNVIADSNTSSGFNYITSSNNITTKNCKSVNNNGCGYAANSSYNIYYYNNVSDNVLIDGFTTTGGCHDFVYAGNIVTRSAVRNPNPGSDGDGFTSHDTCYNLDFFFNVAAFNANTAFAMIQTSAGRIYHNTSYKNGNGVNTGRGGYYFRMDGENATAPAGRKSWDVKNCIGYLDYPRNVSLNAVGKTIVTMDYNSYKAIVDNSFASLDNEAQAGTNISWTTYHATYEANSKNEESLVTSSGMIPYDSPCVDAAPWMVGFNDGGQSDPWGKKVYGLPNVGADQGAGMPISGIIKSSGFSKHFR